MRRMREALTDCDFRHGDDSLPEELLDSYGEAMFESVVLQEGKFGGEEMEFWRGTFLAWQILAYTRLSCPVYCHLTLAADDS